MNSKGIDKLNVDTYVFFLIENNTMKVLLRF